MGKTCSFFGHAHLWDKADNIASQLKQIMIELIEKGVDTFYVGNHGDFDLLSARIACELKEIYPHIHAIVVLCYPSELHYLRCSFTDFLMPAEIETVPKRVCIIRRNYWVVDHSDYIISGVRYQVSRLFGVIQYAQRQQKRIISLF